MAQKRGRPPTPLDPSASRLARLGAELRSYRVDEELTLQELADRIAAAVGRSVTPQHISEVERAKVTPSQTFVKACDATLRTDGALLLLLPAAIEEREARRDKRTEARRAARRTADDPALRCEADSDAGDSEDVKPTNRRGLLGAGAAVALGVPIIGAAPTQARKVDPGLPDHWDDLLRVLGRHDEVYGPGDVLACVQREIKLIAEHRQVARGELRVALMRVEARWAGLAAWLSQDTGQLQASANWTDHASQLAQESGYADMLAFARSRQSKLARDARSAVAYAEDALRVPGAGAQTRAWCARYAAVGNAMAGDTAACERHLATAYGLLDDDDSPAPPWAGGYRVTHIGTLAGEAQCWLLLKPAAAIVRYDAALRDWPHTEARDGGIERARLALACAKVGELDRARAEGRKALALQRATKSAMAERELQRLGQMLKAA